MPIDCCAEFSVLSEGASPFREDIVLGYYDGPTEGIVRCQKCGRVYHYVMVAWDEGQDVRVYALWALRLDLFSQVERLLVAEGPPRYPDWVVRGYGSISETQKRIGQLLDGTAKNASDAVYLVMGETPTGPIRMRSVDRPIREALEAHASQPDMIDDIRSWSSFFWDCEGDTNRS
jgi:hypothetical protein